MRGQSIEGPPHPRDISKNLTLRDVLGALELHVLDPVGQPGLSWLFVTTANAVPGPKRNDGSGVILLQEYSQSVVQLRLDQVSGEWWRHSFRSPSWNARLPPRLRRRARLTNASSG